MYCTQHMSNNKQVFIFIPFLISQSLQYLGIQLFRFREFQEFSCWVICFSPRTNCDFLHRIQFSFEPLIIFHLLAYCNILIMIILIFLPVNSSIWVICGSAFFFLILIIDSDDVISFQRRVSFSRHIEHGHIKYPGLSGSC